MSDSSPEYPSSLLYRCGLGLSIAILIFFSMANIFTTYFIVPKYDQIFQDALPGKPLPPITEFILTYRVLMVIIAVCWPALGVLASLRYKIGAIFWLNIALVVTLLQIGITIIALTMPMVGTITGMSDAPPSALPH